MKHKSTINKQIIHKTTINKQTLNKTKQRNKETKKIQKFKSGSEKCINICYQKAVINLTAIDIKYIHF